MPNIPVFNINGTDYKVKDADLRSEFEDVKNAFWHGKNYFNYKTISKGYVLIKSGGKSIIDVGYTSDYISVKPNTTYNKRYLFHSGTVADVIFYTEDRAFISAFYNSQNTYFRTPVNCAYIRICGYTSDAESEQIEEGNAFTQYEDYQNVISSSAGGGSVAYLFGQSAVIIDQANKQIKLATHPAGAPIYLQLPGIKVKTFTSPISYTGEGYYLYYDLNTNTFSLDDYQVGLKNKVYIGLVGYQLTTTEIDGSFENTFIVSDNPILYYDFVNSKLKVEIGSPAYFWQRKNFVALAQEEYELDLMPESINCVWFNLSTKKFVVNNLFNDYKQNAELVSIGFIWKSNINISVPYIVRNGVKSTSSKNVITYGDSLTWYDGNEFTWGEHQGELCYGYQTYLKKVLGMNVTNRGASGKTTPQIVTNHILTDTSAIRNMNYVIIMPSIMNDDRLGVSPGTLQPIGGTFDDTTTAGALQKAIEFIYSVKPDIRIVIIVEPMGFTYRDNAPQMTNELLPIAIRNVAKLYGIPYIDLWAKSGINALTRNTYFADPTFESGNQLYMYHPNNFGWEVISRIICDEMEAY